MEGNRARHPQPLQSDRELLGGSQEGATRMLQIQTFSRDRSDRTRGDGIKLEQGYKEEVLHGRVVGHWNGLSKDAVNAPSLAVFKARLDGARYNHTGKWELWEKASLLHCFSSPWLTEKIPGIPCTGNTHSWPYPCHALSTCGCLGVLLQGPSPFHPMRKVHSDHRGDTEMVP